MNTIMVESGDHDAQFSLDLPMTPVIARALQLCTHSASGQAQAVERHTVGMREANVQMLVDAQRFGEQFSVTNMIESVALQIQHEQVPVVIAQRIAECHCPDFGDFVLSKVEMRQAAVCTQSRS